MRIPFFSRTERPLNRSERRAAIREIRAHKLGRDLTDDEGLTLMEILISMIIAGTLVTTMTLAYSTFLTTFPETEDRIAISKDVTFVQAWLPIDLASAVDLDSGVNPTLVTDDAALQPSLTAMGPILDTLEGTSVLLMQRIDLQQASHPTYWVNYRYEQRGEEWLLVRYEIRDPGGAGEEVRAVGVAHELSPPPAGWDPTTPPAHAFDVTGRNPGRLRKVGNDVKVTFADGTVYETGGAGLGPGTLLTAVSADGFVNPTSPPTRCGGRMTLVIDSSGSLGSTNVGKVKDAAKDFVDAFQGTPTDLRVIQFDGMAAAVSPTSFSDPAIDMLNLTAAGATTRKNEIEDEIEEDGSGTTNWEDGLRRAITDYSDTESLIKSPDIPDTVVFFTDGIPNRHTTNVPPESGNGDNSYDLSQAKEVSNKKGEWGVTFKGVFVPGPGLEGDARNEAIDRVKQVAGYTEWVAPAGEVGNADAASYFYTENFDELTNIFQQIFVSDCGGTVTVQRRDAAGDPVTNGSYEYSTNTGTGILKAAETRSITFDYEIAGAGEWVSMIETGASGEAVTDVRCFLNGVDVTNGAGATSARVRPLQNDDGTDVLDGSGNPVTNGRDIRVVPNEALSCRFIGG